MELLTRVVKIRIGAAFFYRGRKKSGGNKNKTTPSFFVSSFLPRDSPPVIIWLPTEISTDNAASRPHFQILLKRFDYKKHAVAALTFPHWWFFRDETSKRILSPRWAQALSIERGTSPSLPKFPSSPLWAQAFIWWKLSNSISSLHRAFLKIRLVEPQARGLFTLSQKLGPGLWARAQAHSNSWSFYLNLAFISTFVYRWQG